MIKHRFKNLEVWNFSMKLVEDIYKITSTFPSNEQFGLTSQMRRSAVSIPSNIAEGSGRSTDKEFANFLRIALGSCFELETQIILSKNLEFIKEDNFDQLTIQCEKIQRMLIGFQSKLRNNK